MGIAWLVVLRAHGAAALCFFPAVLWAAPGKLSQTGLYADAAAKTIASGVEAFQPQYPLWSDGARKQRWITLPPGGRIDTSDPDRWTFPVGTKLWKEFAFPKAGASRDAKTGWKRIETRYEVKTSAMDWELRTYLWNDAETDATLAPDDGVAGYYPTGMGPTHDIPSSAQCVQCHRRGGDPVLGFEALQLSDDIDPGAVGKEPLLSTRVTLKGLIARKALTEVPPSLAMPPRLAAVSAEARAALGYLHVNCGSCHNPSGTGGHTGLDFRHTLDVIDPAEEPGILTAVNRFTTVYQIPGETRTYQIRPGDPDRSAVLFRMRLIHGARMPQIGTKVVDAEAVGLIGRWIRGMGR